MHIELVTEGGFAALPGLARPVVLDEANPPAACGCGRSELAALVDAALAERQAVGQGAPSSLPDARSYRITIERDGQREVLVAADALVPPAFAALRDFVRKHGVR